MDFLTGIAVHEALHAGLAPIHAGLSGLWEGAKRESSYVGNSGNQNQIPGIVELIEAWIRKDISDTELAIAMSAHGASVNWSKHVEGKTAQLYNATDKAWRSTINAKFRRPDTPILLELAARGFFGNLKSNSEGRKKLQELTKWTNSKPSDWDEFAKSLRYTFSPIEITELYNRGFFNREEFRERLQKSGVVSQKERDGVEMRARIIPSPQEIAVMARRFAFADQATIDALGLDDEYPDPYKFWAERVGFGEAKGRNPETGEERVYDFAKGFWRQHWSTIAPTLAYQFYIRCREGRDGFGIDPAFKDLVFPFDSPDPHKLSLSLALRDAGYTKAFRPFLAAIANRVLGFRQIGQIQYFGSVPGNPPDKGREWVTQRLQDSGYERKTAETFADTIIKSNDQKRAAQQQGITRTLIEDSWKMGIIDDARAITMLLSIGYSTEESEAAVSAWEVSRVHDIAKKVVAGIRKNYLLGDLTDEEVTRNLTNAGITAERIHDYLELWSIEQRQYRLERTPATLTKWLKIGTLSEPEFRARLHQIGWALEDIDRILAYALWEATKGVKPKDQVPKGKSGRKGMGTPTDLTRPEIRGLYKRGMIKRDEAYQYLRSLGLDDNDTNLLLNLWEKESVPTSVS